MQIDAEKFVLLAQETREYNRVRADEAKAAGVSNRDSLLMIGVLDRLFERASYIPLASTNGNKE